MKILLCDGIGAAFKYIMGGWKNAFTHAGHQFKTWDGTTASWLSYKPDIYIGATAFKQKILSKSQRGKTKVVLHANPCCDTSIRGKDGDSFRLINETAVNVKWAVAQKPDVVFGYGFEQHRKYWFHWEGKHRIKWVPMPTGGDLTFFKPSKAEKSLDISYVGGYWGYKAHNMDQYLIPLLDTDPSYEIGGWSDWPIKIKNIRDVSDSHVLQLFQKSRVCPCIVEPHTTKYGIDLPERVWKVVLSGAVAVHDPIVDMKKDFDSLVIARDRVDYISKVRKYINNKEARDELWRRQYEEVSRNHSYHARLGLLLSELSLDDESHYMIKCAESLYEF